MRDEILNALDQFDLPGGGTLVSRDMVRALRIENGHVQFVIEVPNNELAKAIEPLQAQIQARLTNLGGVEKVSIVLTAHTSAQPEKAPPSLKVGGHPKPQSGPMKPPGVDRIIAIASGKGGVGKSTVSSNLAVALAAEGRRVGLLDADIYGPSQPRMMGINKRPASPDGKTILPLHAHGVTLMSIGFMLEENKAVVWRGPMLMGALQQMISQVAWGELDVLLVDLPPGTGDVQLTLCQKTQLTGAIVVSTPQDVALLDPEKQWICSTPYRHRFWGWLKICRSFNVRIAARPAIYSVTAVSRPRPKIATCRFLGHCRWILPHGLQATMAAP